MHNAIGACEEQILKLMKTALDVESSMGCVNPDTMALSLTFYDYNSQLLFIKEAYFF